MAVWTVYISILAINSCLWLCLYFGYWRARQNFDSRDDDVSDVTVIVAVKNEEHNIPGLLEALLTQSHPQYELIIAVDNSEDGTLDLLRRHPRRDQYKVVETAGDRSGKKYALEAGISAASNEVLVFTDADCRPGRDWLATIARQFGSKEKLVVVGYSPFDRRSGFANRVFRYETFITGFLTAGTIGIHRPYMAVGRNLAYTRQSWDAVDGFARIMHSLSGDDDLLVQQFAREGIDVVHIFGPGSYVRTEPPDTVPEWFRQKKRHVSAGRYYSASASLPLAAFHVSGLVLYTAPFVLGGTGWSILGVSIVVQWIILRKASAVFLERDLAVWQPVLHVLYSIYNLVLAPLGMLTKPRRW
ncbi:MAG: glycosyltransferase [Rhodothermales bacterium]|nr:glycosyltransferase [Rhodothermales bacterium]